MLTDSVLGRDNCVYRSAPTITAARLNRGDTCLAAWALPFGSNLGAYGCLSSDSLNRLQKRQRGKEETSIDEISMLSPDRFSQIERHAAQGTGCFNLFFGGLFVRLSGDFLQLPPVRASSFATPEQTSKPPSGTSKTVDMDSEGSEDEQTVEENVKAW